MKRSIKFNRLNILIILIFLSSCTCKYAEEVRRKEKWEFRIDSMFIDKNHAIPTLILSSKKGNIEWGIQSLKELYNNATIGDSMCKDAGSIEVKLIKKDTIMYFYPICNGEVLK